MTVEMREFVEGCKSCDPRADPDGAAELLKHAVQLGEAILQKREKGGSKENKTDQYLERSERILDMLIKLAENKTAPPKKSSKKSSKPKVVRKKYGEYKHVLLSDEEYARLVSEYGETTVKQKIQAVDEYVQQHNAPYADYNLTIRKWLRDDGNEASAAENEHSYNIDLIVEQARNNPPKMRKKDGESS